MIEVIHKRRNISRKECGRERAVIDGYVESLFYSLEQFKCHRLGYTLETELDLHVFDIS